MVQDNVKVSIAITDDTVNKTPRLDTLFYNKDNYNTDLYLQRGLVWNLKQQSLFIQSLLRNIKPPSIVVNNKDGVYNVVDGGNRLLTIFRFFNNEFAIDKEVSPIGLVDMNTGELKVYEIAGKKFKDFPLELQNHLNTRTLIIDIYNNLDENIETELLFLLNNGTPMKSIDKARIENYNNEIQQVVIEIKSNELFERKLNMATCFKKQRLDEQLIYTIIAEECDVPTTIGRKNYQKISKYILEHSLLNQDYKDKIMNCINYMNKMIPCKTSWFNRGNFIAIYKVCNDLIATDINNRDLFMAIDTFFNNKPSEYTDDKSNKKKYEILKEAIKEILGKEN